MSSDKFNKEGNKLTKYTKKSWKMLTKASNFCIGSMAVCSDKITFNTAMGCPTGHVNSFPRNYSVSSTKSSHEDSRERLPVASAKASHGNKIDPQLQRKQPSTTPGKISDMPRCYGTGIGIGRIDEDEPCNFQDDLKPKPRSNNLAVSR